MPLGAFLLVRDDSVVLLWLLVNLLVLLGTDGADF